MWFICIRPLGAWSLRCVTECFTYILHLYIIYMYTISFVFYVIQMYTSTRRVVFALRLSMVYIHTIYIVYRCILLRLYNILFIYLRLLDEWFLRCASQLIAYIIYFVLCVIYSYDCTQQVVVALRLSMIYIDIVYISHIYIYFVYILHIHQMQKYKYAHTI